MASHAAILQIQGSNVFKNFVRFLNFQGAHPAQAFLLPRQQRTALRGMAIAAKADWFASWNSLASLFLAGGMEERSITNTWQFTAKKKRSSLVFTSYYPAWCSFTQQRFSLHQPRYSVSSFSFVPGISLPLPSGQRPSAVSAQSVKQASIRWLKLGDIPSAPQRFRQIQRCIFDSPKYPGIIQM